MENVAKRKLLTEAQVEIPEHNISSIKNKQRRNEAYMKLKREKAKVKLEFFCTYIQKLILSLIIVTLSFVGLVLKYHLHHFLLRSYRLPVRH